MKNKYFLFASMVAILIIVPNVSFAYNSYGRESQTPMGLIIFLSLIFGILGLCLLIKIWGMTNDIKTIKKKILDEELADLKPIEGEMQYRWLRRNMLAGKVDYVKLRLVDNFAKDVERNFNAQKDIDKKEKITQSIRPLVEKLQKQFDKIGEPIPPYIAKMETYNDYFNMFEAEDFK